MTEHDMKELERRNIFTYLTRDGLLEIAVGFLLITPGITVLLSLIRHSVPDPSTPFYESGNLAFGPLSMLFLFALIITKRTVVYNRTGYAKMKNIGGTVVKVIAFAVPLLLILVLIPLFAERAGKTNAALLIRTAEYHLFWLAMAIFSFLIGRKYQTVRFYFYTLMLTTLPLAVRFTSSPFTTSLALLGSGLVFMLFGIFIFFRFLKTYPAQGEK